MNKKEPEMYTSLYLLSKALAVLKPMLEMQERPQHLWHTWAVCVPGSLNA